MADMLAEAATGDLRQTRLSDPAAPERDRTPLCVDLDGTLVRTDLLVEGLVAIFTGHQALRHAPLLLSTDRARLKQKVAEAAALDVTLLPYNEELLSFLRTERALGRTLVLATAADAAVAHAVADHLGIFDLVLSSDGSHNLKGRAKAEMLVEYFGKGGFDYAGNDRADLPVWDQARKTIVVNAPQGIGGSSIRTVPPIWTSRNGHPCFAVR